MDGCEHALLNINLGHPTPKACPMSKHAQSMRTLYYRKTISFKRLVSLFCNNDIQPSQISRDLYPDSGIIIYFTKGVFCILTYIVLFFMLFRSKFLCMSLL